MSFEPVAAAEKRSRDGRSIPFDTSRMGRSDVAFVRPDGCEEEGPRCDRQRIKSLCHKNPEDTDDDPVDPTMFEKIRPPLLKGVKRGEDVEDSEGLCHNDADRDDAIRELWRRRDLVDPFSRDKIVWMSEATTLAQRMTQKLRDVMMRVRKKDSPLRSRLKVLGHDGFFRDEPDDTILTQAQGLAEVCAARPDEDESIATEDERKTFETVKRRVFDDLFEGSTHIVKFRHDDYTRTLRKCLYAAADVGTFVHGFEKISRVSNPRGSLLETAAKYGATRVLRDLLQTMSEEEVKNQSNQAFDGAVDDTEKPVGAVVETVGVLVKNSKVDVNHIANSDWREGYGDYRDTQTPLVMAIEFGNAMVVKRLLQRKDIDVNKQTEGEPRLTPLRAVAWVRGQSGVEIAEMLLSRDDIVVDKEAIEIADEQGQKEIAGMLRAKLYLKHT